MKTVIHLHRRAHAQQLIYKPILFTCPCHSAMGTKAICGHRDKSVQRPSHQGFPVYPDKSLHARGAMVWARHWDGMSWCCLRWRVPLHPYLPHSLIAPK